MDRQPSLPRLRYPQAECAHVCLSESFGSNRSPVWELFLSVQASLRLMAYGVFYKHLLLPPCEAMPRLSRTIWGPGMFHPLP